MSGSMTSPLLLQALTGMNQQQDPALAAQLPKLQLAQALMQQGSDASPTSKWGGISRLASALTGSLAFNQANNSVQDVLKGRQQATTDSLARMNAAGTPAAPPPTPQPPPTSQAPAQGGVPFVAKNLPSDIDPATDAMVRTVVGEAGGESPTGQQAVAHVIQNRTKSSGLSPQDVIFAPNQFEPWNNPAARAKLEALDPASPAYQTALSNVRAVTSGSAPDPTNGATHFYSPTAQKALGRDPPSWGSGTPSAVIGGHNFYNAGYQAPAGGSVQVAGPGAPTGAASSAVGAPPAGAAPSQYPPNFQRGLDMMHAAQQEMAANPYNQEIQQSGQRKIQEAAEIMKLETYQQTAPGTYQSSTGKPVFAPSPRVFSTPQGGGGAVGGGGQVTPLYSPDPAAMGARKAAEAQGAETGKQAVATAGKMVQLGHDSDSAIGNIDYGVNQLHQAAAGGINSGYFAPWLATAAAAGKSLGIDLHGLGIDPAAVGNVQSAQKTLGVVAGNILQNTIGKDSQITDAKIDHFIHTQPGIETDPEAIQRVLGWARSQFVYNREMAMDAMHRTDPNTGMLPPGWQASFIAKKGAFAPIYDPLSGEMKQPTGEGPSAIPAGTARSSANLEPPIPGAKQAPDHNWYIPDPARSGKYLQVK